MISKRRIISILLSIILTLSMFGTFAFAANESSEDSSASIGKKYTDTQLGIARSASVKALDKKYRTVLVMGLDNGNRSDMILLLSINRKSGAAKLSSVTRSTYMQLSDKKKYKFDGKTREFSKCNRAYEQAEDPDLALMRELNRHLDLNIREYIGLDWECTADLINELRSMGIKVTGKITNSSMRTAINKLKPKEGKIKKTGTVALKGWQAVQYLRVRKYTGGSPLVRENRSREFLIQLFKKSKKMKLSQVQQAYDAIKGRLHTNMNWEELHSTLSLLLKNSITDDSTAWPYKYSVMWDSDGYFDYFVPTDLASNVKSLHKKLYPDTSYKASSTVKKLSKKIEKKRTGYLKKTRPTIADAKISTPAGTFTGKKVKADPKVVIGGRRLIKGEDYKLISYKNNEGVGKASFKVKGVGYTGSKKASFTINPAGTELKEPAAVGSTFITVSWEKQSAKMTSKRITGYQLQYGTKKSFKSASKKKVTGYNKTSKRITGLKSGKKYYVRIRTFMKLNGKTYYSPWSDAQSIVTE